MKVEFMSGHKMPCDYGSRHPDKLPDNLTKEQREEIGVETEEEDMEVWLRRVLHAITMQQLQDDTDKDPELKTLLQEKLTGTMSKATSKGPYGKMWNDIPERDGILLKGNQIIRELLQVRDGKQEEPQTTVQDTPQAYRTLGSDGM